MAGTINFESSWKKKEYREQKAQYREEYIDKLKAQHEKAERKKEQARLRGEDTWMLPSVSERITQEQQDLESAGKSKKKKEKKQKKEKKRKKKKNRSDSDSDGGPQWAEVSAAPSQKPAAATVKGPQLEPGALKGPQLERDSWMIQPESSDFDFLPSITKNQFNEDRKKAKQNEEDEKEKMLLETPGQHELELNPFWRDGGSGLPEEEGVSKKSGSKRAFTAGAVAGDGGAGWWRKAYQRCVELAEQDGRSLEDVAGERYGSLKKLETLMKGAEKSAVKSRQIERSQRDCDRYTDPRDRDNNPRARGRGEHSDRGRSERDRPKPMFKKPSSDDDERSQESRHRDTRGSPPAWKRKGFRKPGEDDESSTERKRTFMRPGEDRSPERDRKRTFMKPGDDSDRHSSYKSRSSRDDYVPRWKKQDSSGSRRSRSRSRERRDERSRSRERSSRSDRRSRSRSRERSSRSDRRSRSRERTDRDRRSRSREQTNRDRRSRSGSRERGRRSRSGSRDRDRSRQIRHASPERRKRPVSPSSESAISDSSPSSSDSESDQEMAPPQPPAPPPKVLTETELNALGAKMVRAEIMGDEELAVSLKTQITAARAAREQQPVTMVTTRRPGREEEGDMDVVLTRTDRSGNVRPLPSREHDTTGKRRGKKQKVKTHSDAGTRERYFHDDDNKDLKTLVQQERLGTAEDSNIEFLKLAAKSFKGTNPDDADEVFVDGAAQHKSAATIELKDRAKAIAEHKKTAAAMERCSFCFDKVPKHLIIAIGLKVYLCLPNHRSMTEGHCLIVPMQHTTQSTVLDEDVYEEIQVYRRALVKLYASQDQDCVFMETSMQLYKQRHMAIECVPLDRELGDMAPIYFKKAMQEAGPEWAQNKKVVDLSKKNIKNAVPKGFPYFAVDFGLQGGFAHVIEDDKTFPFYFGREIVGGMMDLEPTLWRKPHKESFEDQRKKVLQFAEWWKPFDWTQKVKQAMMDSD